MKESKKYHIIILLYIILLYTISYCTDADQGDQNEREQVRQGNSR